MKFQKINFIFSLLSFNLIVLSENLNEDEVSFSINNNSNKPENVTDSINISEGEKYYTIMEDEDIVNVTDTIIEEETDSDGEVETTLDIDTNECTSEECIKQSKRILSLLDTSVNPCDDFYEFSCGGWINTSSFNDPFEELTNKVLLDIDELLRSNYKANEKLTQKEREYDEKMFNTLKNYYTICTDFYKKFDNKNDIIIDYINKFNLTKRISSRNDFSILLAELHNNGINILFNLSRDECRGLPYKYIPYISGNIYSKIELRKAFVEIEYSKEGFSARGHFNNENEYNEFLQKQHNIIDNTKIYIKEILQLIYGSNVTKDKIDTVVESVMKVEKIFSKTLFDTEEGSKQPIYSTESNNDYNENEATEYYNGDFHDFIDDDYNNEYYDEYTSNYTDEFMDEDNTDYEYNYNDYFNDGDIVSIQNFNEKYPLINWKLYLENRFKYYGIEIPINEELMIEDNDRFKSVYECFEEIDDRDLANYIEWMIIETFVANDDYQDIISKNIFQIRNKYVKFKEEKHIFESRNEEEKEKVIHKVFPGEDEKSRCLSAFDSFSPLSYALARYYVERTFNEDNRLKLNDMIDNIKKAMVNRIQELDWLDESTRKYAIEKTLKIKYNIAYDDFIMDTERIYKKVKPYENVHINPISILLRIDASVGIWKYSNIYNESYADNDEENIEDEYIFIMPAFVVNAMYTGVFNTMYFPAAILQSPFFDVNQPDYVNYGILGFLMGHELNHAYDSNGRTFDAEGKLINWWTDNDNEDFNELSQCFIDQYNNYSSEVNGKKYFVDGKYTLNENLADNGGLDRAFEAWKALIESNSEQAKESNMKLPGLSEYSKEQLFYISFAQGFCKSDNKIVKSELHSPNKFRVQGVISNSKRFAKIFNCPVNSPMNPSTKCNLW